MVIFGDVEEGHVVGGGEDGAERWDKLTKEEGETEEEDLSAEVEGDGKERYLEISVFMGTATKNSAREDAETECHNFGDECKEKENGSEGVALEEGFGVLPDGVVEKEESKNAEDGDEAEKHREKEGEDVDVPVGGCFDG